MRSPTSVADSSLLRRSLVAATAVLLAVAVIVVDVGARESRGDDRPVALPLPPTHYTAPDDAVFVAPSGGDDATGGKGAPLRTLTAAVRRVPSGGTIVLRAGTYRESAGTIGKRVTIQPASGERVWFKGSRVVPRWTRTADGWEHTDWQSDLCREDCYLPQIIDPEHPLAGKPEMVFMDGRPLRQVAKRDDVKPGTFFADAAKSSVVIGDDPRGRTVEVTVFDHLLQFDPGAAGSVLRGVGVAQYGSRQQYGARSAMVVVNAPDVRVARTTFAHSASTGLAVFQPGVRVTRSTMVNNGLVGLQANRADRLRVTRSTFTGNNAERFTVRGEAVGAAGAKVTRTRKAYFARNVFERNAATGWWCDLGCTDATVIRNRAVGNAGHGLFYEVSSGALIGSNLLLNNRRHGVKIAGSDGVGLYHNTFAGNSLSLGLYNDPREPSFDAYSEDLGLSWLTADLVSVNNVFAGGRPHVDSADYRPEPDGNPGFVRRSDGNAYLHDRGARGPLAVLVTGDGKSVRFNDLAALRRAGFDEHGVEHSRPERPFTDDHGLRPSTPGRGIAVGIPRGVANALDAPPDGYPHAGVLPPR